MMKLNLNRVSRKLKSLTIGYYRSQKFFQNRHVNFLIIGVQKAGTTSLAHFLAQHPQCMTAKSKEVHFFDLDYRYNNGINWYHRQFDLDGYNSQNEPVCIFEKSPGYIFYPDAAKRIYDYNPKMKLIVLFREPAERAYSAWNMWRQLREKDYQAIVDKYANKKVPTAHRKAIIDLLTAPDYPDFACFVEREIGYLQQKQDYSFPYFVKRGLYAEQVEAYLRYFPLQQMLFLDNEALKQKKVAILQKIETFLDLPTHNWGQTALVDQHVRSYQTQDMDTLKQLKRFYGPYNQKLYQQIGQVFNW